MIIEEKALMIRKDFNDKSVLNDESLVLKVTEIQCSPSLVFS